MPWYYAHVGTTERRGPISSEQMRDLIQRGTVGANDVAWRDGMAQWIPVRQVPQLASFLPQAAQPYAAATPAPGAAYEPSGYAPPAYAQPAYAAPAAIGPTGPLTYYTARSEMPTRVKQNLAKFAPPTGPTGEWPLAEDQVSQLGQAIALRKRINGGYNTARLLFALSAIGLVGYAVVGAFALSESRGRTSSPELIAMAVSAVVSVGLTVLYGVGGRAIKYCKSWGSLVLAILTTLLVLAWIALICIGIAAAPPSRSGQDQTTAVLVGGGIVVLVFFAITWSFWRAFIATGRYLATPVWCQDAIAVSENAK